MSKPTILINLERCTGCWTCSLACKVGNQLADDEWWQFVRTLGNGSGIDRPAGVWPDLHMSWMPIHTSKCHLCSGRVKHGSDPYCVHNCPNDAMTYGDLDDEQDPLNIKMKDLQVRGYRTFRLPSWEQSNSNIIYAEKE